MKSGDELNVVMSGHVSITDLAETYWRRVFDKLFKPKTDDLLLKMDEPTFMLFQTELKLAYMNGHNDGKKMILERWNKALERK